MNSTYNNLYPREVFRFFKEISDIPRGSGNEGEISNYLVKFAKDRGLSVIQDEALNVIIKKPGTSGYENSPAVIIQGHMDMVCEKNMSKVHDFEKDPIELRVVEDMLYANDTTLGADNGIAVAFALALLDSRDIPHPPFEAVITTGEEVGLVGAAQLDTSSLQGRLLINLDAEGEGKLIVGCAGGVRVRAILPITWESPKKDYIPYQISISGLKGGHSGGEIDKGRANSNKLMGRLLYNLLEEMEYSINSISGGLKMNAIPREARAVIYMEPGQAEKLEGKIIEWQRIFKNEYRVSDPGVSVSLEKLDTASGSVFSRDTTRKTVLLLVLIPNGIQTMSMDVKGLVESSTNLGVVNTTESEVSFESALRSSVPTFKKNIYNQIKALCELMGVEFLANSDYPAWQYDPDSRLRALLERIYMEKYGSNPVIEMVHGGLECGLFKDKMPGLDAVSFGPEMYDIHTPNEHISIPSIGRTWDYLCNIIKELK